MTEAIQSKRGLTSFGLHILAMALMLCDHLWGTYLWQYEWLSYLGRITFPIFAFLLAEGFFHTADKKKYLKRLVLFAVIAEIPFNLMMGHSALYPIHQNVLWTFALAVLMMIVLQWAGRKKLPVRIPLYLLTVMVFCVLGFVTFVDYYGYGLLIVALFYFTHRSEEDCLIKKIMLFVVQAAVLWWICDEIAGLVISFELFGVPISMHKQALSLLALIPIWLYRGEQGPYNKVIRGVYYWFYPAHMLLLGLPFVLL